MSYQKKEGGKTFKKKIIELKFVLPNGIAFGVTYDQRKEGLTFRTVDPDHDQIIFRQIFPCEMIISAQGYR